MSDIENVSNFRYIDAVLIHYRLFFDVVAFSMPSRYVSRTLTETVF